VGKECTTDQLDVVFDKWSVEFRLRGYRNQNLIFSIKRLFGEIIPSESKYLLKNNSLNLVLTKRENKSWSQVAFKEEKLGGKSEKAEEKEDPQAGIMNMMKKMYEEGDENMKRTIAEAWTKANDKKAQGEQPDFSDRYDFLKK
jgi:calcyclin binding protein